MSRAGQRLLHLSSPSPLLPPTPTHLIVAWAQLITLLPCMKHPSPLASIPPSPSALCSMAISMHVLDYDPPSPPVPPLGSRELTSMVVSPPLGHRVNCLFTSSPILPPPPPLPVHEHLVQGRFSTQWNTRILLFSDVHHPLHENPTTTKHKNFSVGYRIKKIIIKTLGTNMHLVE